MAVYFQKISSDQFNTDSSFEVKESKQMRLFIGIIALCIAAVAVTTSSIYLAIAAALFGVSSIVASRKTKLIMRVNKEGFFYHGFLVTDWANFVSARFLDEMPQLSKSSLGISDEFFLVLRYRKEKGGAVYERRFPLTNTQDKAEEEVLAAIRYYYEQSGMNGKRED